MKGARTVLILFLLLVILRPASPVKGQGIACPAAGMQWEQLYTQSFALIYAPENIDPRLLDILKAGLDGEYARLEMLFKTSLQLPVNIRVYPSEEDFFCLNTNAVRQREFTHTRVGGREIALIQKSLLAGQGDLTQPALNGLRYELGVLFAAQMTDNKVPPGLAASLGGYLQEPAFTMQQRPNYGWTRDQASSWFWLWQDPATESDRARQFEATTTAAFLVDLYGWPNYLEFIKRIATSEDAVQALAEIYDQEAGDLEEKWLQYVPYYIGGRWKAHALYDYDLSAYQTLIQQGAYEDAASGLRDAIAFLDESEQVEKAGQARDLLQRALDGQAAGALVQQARQALLEQQYQRAVALSDQAAAIYSRLGDARRREELAAYRSWANEVLSLRMELEDLQEQAGADPASVSTARLAEVGSRLGSLGDRDGLDRARAAVQAVHQQLDQGQSTRYLLGIGLAVLLLALRVVMLRMRKHPEAQL